MKSRDANAHASITFLGDSANILILSAPLKNGRRFSSHKARSSENRQKTAAYYPEDKNVS